MSDTPIYVVAAAVLLWYFLKNGGLVFMWIQYSAWRIGLRDKGPNPRWRCPACHTGLRVGIMLDGGSVDYCWRCEEILDMSEEPDPDDELDIPNEKVPDSHQAGGNVLPFKKRFRLGG